jgi:hypothetical protein
MQASWATADHRIAQVPVTVSRKLHQPDFLGGRDEVSIHMV